MDNTQAEKQKKYYGFVQDVLFWHGNERSPHYKEETYGSSFNTHGFCEEYAEKLRILFQELQNELLDAVVADAPKKWGSKNNGAKGSIMWSQALGHDKAVQGWLKAVQRHKVKERK